jgi:hypothetical protein
VATWDFVHEQQPIWDLKLTPEGNLLSVGSDCSVAMWRTPQQEHSSHYSNFDPFEKFSDPSEYLLGRFRKPGKLGHFLTPTSACWLSGNS